MGAFAFILSFYSKAVLSPNSYLFSGNGDGIKNYFTYAYHIKNNESLSNFEGFNYPYGENFLYTDGHPLLISILKPIHSVFPGVANYSIGILNSLMLLSLLISALVLFQLLRELKINAFLAMLGAWSILILAPQIFRMEGHFALSYSFVIPLCFLWLTKFTGKERSGKHLIYLTVLHAALLFIHAYLSIISISILIAYFLIDGAYNDFKNANSWSLLGSAFLSMVPFLAVKSYSDFHEYRTNNPYGFFEYYADFDTVLLPHHGGLKDYIFNQFPSFTQTWEGWAYIGVGSIILIPFIVFFFFRNFTKAKIQPINKILLAASLLLVFSFGFPFRLGLESVLEYVPILKQFRAIGRFAWVFYFAISTYAFYLINFWSEHIQPKFGKVILMLLLPVLMIAEGLPYHFEVGSNISQSTNSFNKTTLDEDFSTVIAQLDPTEFQAIVPIPFYNIGSENYEKEASKETYLNSMILSYHTGLPLTSSYLTRVSLKESRNEMQFFAPSFYDKTIKSDLSSTLPFLVVWSKKEFLEKEEMDLLKSVKWIKATDNFSIGMLPYSAIFENTAQQEIQTFTSDSTLIRRDDYYLSDSAMLFYNHVFKEKGSFLLVKKPHFRNDNYRAIDQEQKNNLFTIYSSSLHLGTTYEASIWVSNSSRNEGQDDLNHLEFVMEEKGENGSIIQSVRKEVMSTFTHFEGWSLVQLEFSPISNNSDVEFYITGNSPSPKTSFVADFLLRDIELDVFKILESDKNKPIVLYKNNHSIKMESDAINFD
ncbi:MAG: hypothetical protein ACJAV5_000709 [Vicingaceae bacterium]